MKYLLHLFLEISIFQIVISWYHPHMRTAHTFDPILHPNWDLLDHEGCGIGLTDRIIGGHNATMGQYPWIARVGYASKSQPKSPVAFKCGASLINSCYVVTAAHCVYGIPRDLYVAGIRLGEHDEDTDIDCHRDYCSDQVQDFYPVRILIHRNYGKPTFKNDISLIKLDRPVELNSWVKPICLPYANLMEKDFLNQYAEVAGWGIFNMKIQRGSKVLQTVKLPVVDVERCIRGFQHKVLIDSDQLCVGGTVGKDSCGGDSGGPLMKVEAVTGTMPKYYLIGLVSFGAKMCAETDMPAIYTKISAYMPWILDNIEYCT